MNRSVLLVLAVVLFLFLNVQATKAIASPVQYELHQPPAIILFIGDGMGEAQREAGSWFSVGQDGQLNMETLPVSGWSITSNISGTITDSAAAATAMATGEKTLNGRISVDISGISLPTILEQAQEQGWSTGLVSNVQITHATPAAFASHEINRTNTITIAEQILDHKVNVLLAGGEDDWFPETETGCYPNPGHRIDGRNLIAEAIAGGYTYICEGEDLAILDFENETQVLGLFADDGMLRPYTPTLTMMTTVAIEILSRDPDGFFLMVEGGQIDWAAHMNDGGNVITDVLGIDSAIAQALDYASINPNTLIIVTGDHETGGMSADLVSSGQPDEDGPFLMPDGTPFYINWTTIYHTGVDVPVMAFGPKSEFLIGTYENTHIYEVMRRFLGWQVNLPLIHR